MAMMLVIEYLNILSRGNWSKSLENSPAKQIIFAALLGVIPGCLGAYTAVSLYLHNILSTGALVATMIASSGDEAFFMFSVIPEKAILIQLILFVIAIIAGFIVNAFWKKRLFKYPEKHLHIHKNETDCVCFNTKEIVKQLRKISLLRIVLLILMIVMLIMVIINLLHSDHEHEETAQLILDHHQHPMWISITFIVVLAISFFIVLTANEHFIKEHILNHIIKKHFLRIFLWTFGTLAVLTILNSYINLEEVIGNNLYVVLLVALLVGIVPQSGPHMIFVLLFASGSIPISILIASSVVQDGHGSLPLLAESRKSFIVIKIINVVVGFLIGTAGLLLGF
ncbi:MAG: hypothetical protein C0598_11525 [Marinilabiliales bacterium]|nr:MAG: hypothetical protein C0598_11525 [Marinilabiliales bacterium]